MHKISGAESGLEEYIEIRRLQTFGYFKRCGGRQEHARALRAVFSSTPMEELEEIRRTTTAHINPDDGGRYHLMNFGLQIVYRD